MKDEPRFNVGDTVQLTADALDHYGFEWYDDEITVLDVTMEPPYIYFFKETYETFYEHELETVSYPY